MGCVVGYASIQRCGVHLAQRRRRARGYSSAEVAFRNVVLPRRVSRTNPCSASAEARTAQRQRDLEVPRILTSQSVVPSHHQWHALVDDFIIVSSLALILSRPKSSRSARSHTCLLLTILSRTFTVLLKRANLKLAPPVCRPSQRALSMEAFSLIAADSGLALLVFVGFTKKAVCGAS